MVQALPCFETALWASSTWGYLRFRGRPHAEEAA